jgi:hypothetical protein
MFKPGKSGNPKGRPKDKPNKVGRPLKTQIADFLNERFAELPGIWSKLPPRERARLFCDLLPFILPKVSSIDLDMNFAQLSEQDLDRIIEGLLNKDNE